MIAPLRPDVTSETDITAVARDLTALDVLVDAGPGPGSRRVTRAGAARARPPAATRAG